MNTTTNQPNLFDQPQSAPSFTECPTCHGTGKLEHHPNPGPSVRTSDPETSRDAARSVGLRRGSQREKILSVFVHNFPTDGLSSFDAGRISGLAARPGCCYWKRVSELAQMGHIAPVGRKRNPETGEDQTTYRVTALGVEQWKAMA